MAQSSPWQEAALDTGTHNIPTFVQLDRLTKSFQEGLVDRQVLREITATFATGEFVVLLGQSGSGKSTLLNLLSGIEQPTTGQVTINSVKLSELNERDRTLFRRDRIGFIFQFFNLIPTLTVLENITLPQELAGVSQAEVSKKAIALLQRVGLEDRGDAFPDKLSGGQQQRVAIARALVHDPMLVLADEPTGNLDEETGKIVLDLLLELTRSAQKTLIMATHNPEIAQLADRVVRMLDGHLVEDTRLGAA
ncbi:ABC transporter ATP-binding protein [Acaryochloris sp. IP29b_bin.137]|uniref:ABC transporter ATP-binding protein n=1 Tax=Acaryochloris sp. IP29b_bin.137 TaxID=2969217 RepID=UPI00262208C8|nr:ABC transporter ATP-binding protein [Acaryochloris sp. IP29b_bin.137]